MDFFARTDPALLPAAVDDLPLVLIEAKAPRADVFVVWISGDGGWSILEREIAGRLAEADISTIGLNSFLYFANARTPQRVAADLTRIANSFSERWPGSRILFVGYSFGADSAPAAFAADPALPGRFDASVFLSPSPRTYEQRGPTSWLGLGGLENNVAVLNRLRGPNLICVRGEDDEHAACPLVRNPAIAQIAMPSGHTLHGDGRKIAELILKLSRGPHAR
jgi:type IV secretory pathway VirJ component